MEYQRKLIKIFIVNFSALESGRVIIEKTLQPYPLECAIWTYWAYSGKPQKDMLILNQFLNVFGIPIIVQTPDEAELINFLLNQETRNSWVCLQYNLQTYFSIDF